MIHLHLTCYNRQHLIRTCPQQSTQSPNRVLILNLKLFLVHSTLIFHDVPRKTSQELRKLPVTSYLESQVQMSVLSCPVLSTKTTLFTTTTMTDMTTMTRPP